MLPGTMLPRELLPGVLLAGMMLAGTTVFPALAQEDGAAGRDEKPCRLDDDELGLRQAIATALACNLDLSAASASTRAALASIDEAESARLPIARLELGAQHTDNPALVFSNKLGQEAFEQADFALSELNQPDALSNFYGRLSLEAPLFTGGRLASRIGSAKELHGAAEQTEKARRQQVTRAVVEAHTHAVVARREVAVAAEAVKTARANLRLMQDLHQGGLVVASDPLRAEVRLAEVKALQIRAESRAAVGRARLAQVLGVDLGGLPPVPEDLPAATSPSPGEDAHSCPGRLAAVGVEKPGGDAPGEVDGEVDGEAGGEAHSEPVELDAYLAEAATARPELGALSRRQEAARLGLEGTRAERKPELGVAGFYEANSEDFFGADGDNYAVTLQLRWNLFDRGRAAREARADAALAESRARAAAMARAVDLQVRQAFYEVCAAARQVDASERAGELAERGLEIVRDRYRNGLGTATELLESETALTQARLRHLAARRDLALARASLHLALGRP